MSDERLVPWITKVNSTDAPEISTVSTIKDSVVGSAVSVKPDIAVADDGDTLIPTIKKTEYPY